MIRLPSIQEAWIRQQAQLYKQQTLPDPLVVINDTTNFMSIERDHVISLDGKFFLVRCNEREGRFTIDEQPKFWVKRALALDTGKVHILKLSFTEKFNVRIGHLQIKCSRNLEKEAKVLQLVIGDSRFMQGHSALDTRGNLVRIIDFITGDNLLTLLSNLRMPHQEYFHEVFPDMLGRIMISFAAIQQLHDNGLCHGDIRNDHILIDSQTGEFKWIDFDLTQAFSDFDVWSIGNILHCITAKGFVTFHEILRQNPDLYGRLNSDDASVFFQHRLMNLRKVYPYIPEGLNKVLMRFSMGTQVYYESVNQILQDLGEWVTSMNWEGLSNVQTSVGG